MIPHIRTMALAGFAGMAVSFALGSAALADSEPKSRIRFGDITCTGGSFSLTVNPAIRSVILQGEKSVQFNGTMDLGVCESLQYPDINNGKMTFRATANAGCDITFITGFIKDGTGQGEITWDTGQRSTFKNASWRGTLSEISLQHANITEGFLKGGTVELTAVSTANVVSNATGCSAFGVERLEGYVRQAAFLEAND